MLKKTTV